MEEVRTEAKEMTRLGMIIITQKDKTLDPDKEIKGPIRLRLSLAQKLK